MRDARRIGAFFSGFFLYSAAISLAIVLADVRLPMEVYARLGGRNSLTMVLIEALAIGLVLFVIALLWAYPTIRPTRKGRHTTTSWCLSGLGLAWLAWLVYGVIYFALSPQSYNQPLLVMLLSSDAPPLWGLLNLVSLVCGIALASNLAMRWRPRSGTADRNGKGGSGNNGNSSFSAASAH